MSKGKIAGILGGVLLLAAVVAFTVVRAQSGYTKVLTGKVERGDLQTVVSGTGQIKPKTYANIGATAFGRITRLYVKEGEHVHKGQVLATIENVQPEASVDAQRAAIEAARTDISSYLAAEKTAQANVEHAQADLEQKRLDLDRYNALYKEKLVSKQDYDARKAAYDLDVATLAQSQAALAQAKANTDSARGHLGTQQATLRSDVDALNKTVSQAPFDGLVTNLPVRQGETVVVGIQSAEGSTLMTLADMSVVTAEVKIDETDIVNLKMGQPADVVVDALPGHIYKGHVTEVGDQALLRSTGAATLATTTGTEEAKDFKVIVTLDDAQDVSALKPGLSATAKITTAHKTNVVNLPLQALVPEPAPAAGDGNKVEAATTASGTPRQGVFVIQEQKGKLHAHFVPLITGVTGATDIEVGGDVHPGEEIVIGTYKTLRGLKDGALVKRERPEDAAKSGA